MGRLRSLSTLKLSVQSTKMKKNQLFIVEGDWLEDIRAI
jgi:hypothetical protein